MPRRAAARRGCRASRPRTRRAPSATRTGCSSRPRAGSRSDRCSSARDPPRLGVDVRRPATDEAAESDAAVGGELDGEARGRADRDENRATGDGGFLHELEREPATHAEHMLRERQEVLPERPADDLVQRVVAADVLARAQELAARGEEPRRVQSARDREAGLRLAQTVGEPGDERERHAELRVDARRLERALAADAARRRREETPLQASRIEAGRVHLDRVGGEVVGEPRARRAQSLREAEPERELLVVAGSTHRHRDRPAPDADLERLLDGHLVSLLDPAGKPGHIDGGGRVGRHVHRRSVNAYDRRVRVLVLGSGGREHALAWALARDASVEELHAAPGNPGIAALATCHPVRADDHAAVASLARELAAGLVVVGPEAPLVAGLADDLRQRGIVVFGPSAAAARIEGSKVFAKEVMEAAGVRTARTLAVARPPCVVKADGLASGKGVWVCRTEEELDAALRSAQALGQPFHVEELLEGAELSLFAVAVGTAAVALPPARDFKRIGDGDTGPNTGGMGSFSPLPDVPDAAATEILETVHLPVLRELARRGTPFHGLLYAGLMRTGDTYSVIEFNCRFGDPETQSLLPRLEGDLLPLLLGDLPREPAVAARAAVTVVLAARDYPARSDDRGTAIVGVEEAAATGALVLHAGTALHEGRLVTNGGRILNVVARR